MTEPLRKAVDEGYPMPPPVVAAEAPAGRSAGAMLRAAREKQGIHIAVLAATIKVSTAKLEALEQDRLDALPNATFARALAQSVCRSLKVDPRPVLQLLPIADAPPLEGTVGPLNTPFLDRPARESAAFTLTSKPLFWAGGLLLLAAVAVYWLPAHWIDADPPTTVAGAGGSPAATVPAAAPTALPPAPIAASAQPAQAASPLAASTPPVTSATPTAVIAPGTVPTSMAAAASAAAAPESVPPAPASAAAPPVRAGIARLSTSAESWVEVQDSAARILLSRTLQPGESVGVDGTLPLRLRIGNAASTQLTFRGQPVDLAAHTRDNVARVELR